MGATLALVVVLACAIAWSTIVTYSEHQSEVRAEASSAASAAAATLGQQLDAIDGLAKVLTRHPAVFTFQQAESERLFASLFEDFPLVLSIVTTDANGTIRSSALAQAATLRQMSPLPYVQQVLSSGEAVVSELTTGLIEGTPVIVLAYPVREQNSSVVGVMGIALGLTRLQAMFARIPLPEGSVVTLTDAKGRVLARSTAAEKHVGSVPPHVPVPDQLSPSTMEAGVDGVVRFAGKESIARGPWVLGVGIPSSVVLSRLVPLWQRNLIIVTSVVLAALLLSLWQSNRTSRGLHGLQVAARRIANGDLSPPARVRAPNLEIAQLRDAFITMAANLQEIHLALDRQVEQERKMREMLESLQMQVVRQERLAAVGLLVSGVAHELNNPLQAILGTVELLERHGNLSPEGLEEIAFVKTQSGRARDIIRNLARFSSQRSSPPSIIDLRQVITEVVRLRRQDLENSLIIVDVEASSSRSVMANFTELEQVTLNFVINAQQSIQSTGRSGGRILIRSFDTGKRVRLEVQDNGPGVLVEDEPKLFQPFFTTKPTGKGTGLGLSVSYGIIDSYGGSIGHHRNEWGGATFFFELPAVEGQTTDDRTVVLQRPVSPGL
jgi:C4-dicarboxylate-specific signal transduction histidine kinase